MDRLTGSSALAVEVQVLRAGAAASAERIKALEAELERRLIRPSAAAVAAVAAGAIYNIPDRAYFVGPPPVAKEPDQ